MEWINQNTGQCDVILDGFNQLPYKMVNVTVVRPQTSHTENILQQHTVSWRKHLRSISTAFILNLFRFIISFLLCYQAKR